MFEQMIGTAERVITASNAHATEITLGKMQRDSKEKAQEKYMSEVTVDKL